MRTPRRLLKQSFWNGFLVAMLWQLLVQDYMGLERYVAYVQRSWVVLPWWPWAVAIGLFIYVQKAREGSVTDKPIGKEVES